LEFHEEHWRSISHQAKDLIKRLLVKDSVVRLTAEQILSHPWIVNQTKPNQRSSAVLHTPVMLNKHQESLKTLEDFASKILEAKRALEESSNPLPMPINANATEALAIPCGRQCSLSFNLSPVNISNCELLKRRRRKSKELFSKFLSIDELETDFFMKAIS